MSVLVAGAGIIGTAIADALAARGVAVTVFDMRSPGRGASQASAGILAPFTEAHEKGDLLALGRRSLDLYDDFIGGVCERSGLDVEYSRSGTLEVALTDRDEQALVLARSALSTERVHHEWLTGADLRAREPALTPDARGGLLIPAHGFVNVPALLRALIAGARRHGAVFEAPVEVRVIDEKPTHVRVQTGQAWRDFDHVVLAAGSWSGRVRMPGGRIPGIRPVRGQLLHLRWRGETTPSRVVWSPSCYAVPWADGSLLVGATVEDVGFDESATVAGVEALTRAAIELLPGARDAVLEHIRVGLRPAGAGQVPTIGAHGGSSRITIATGHYRNGILLAPVTAALVAERVTGSLV